MLESDPQPIVPAVRARATLSGATAYGGERIPGLLGAPAARTFYIRLAPPRLTYLLIFAILAMFVATLWYGYRTYGIMNGSENINVLVDMGAKVNQLVAMGETWRLFTAMFLHIGVLHLVFNLYALYAIGSLVEPYYGSVRFLVIYLLGGLFGSLGSYAFSDAISAGASGAVFAITGAAAVYFFRYRENFGAHGRALLQNMVVILVINLAFGVAGSGVDNWGHFGGLVGGVLLAWGLLPRYRVPTEMEIHTATSELPMVTYHNPAAEIAWTIAMALVLAGGVYLTTQLQPERVLQLLG